MIEFKTNGKNGELLWNIPTKLEEITPEYLTDVTANIDIADNYSLIALCYHEKLSTIILANRQLKKNTNINVVPVYVKCGKTDNNFINDIKCGEKILVAGSDIAMGFHVSVPANKLTINHLVAAIEGDGYAYQNSMKHNDFCYFIEFKLVPNVAIHARYSDKEITSKCPFVNKVKEGA